MAVIAAIETCCLKDFRFLLSLVTTGNFIPLRMKARVDPWGSGLQKTVNFIITTTPSLSSVIASPFHCEPCDEQVDWVVAVREYGDPRDVFGMGV
jgi:hypothetical protein